MDKKNDSVLRRFNQKLSEATTEDEYAQVMAWLDQESRIKAALSMLPSKREDDIKAAVVSAQETLAKCDELRDPGDPVEAKMHDFLVGYIARLEGQLVVATESGE